MPSPGIGVRIVGGADGIAMQALQAVVSSKAPPEENQVLAYSPCSDSLTMSEFLHHSAKWNFIYPSFEHISDLIKKELNVPNYCVSKYQGFFQLTVGSLFFLPAIIFFFISAISKLSIDAYQNDHTLDYVTNFVNPFQSIGSFFLTTGLATFALSIVFRNKKQSDETFEESKQIYKDYRNQLILPHNLMWTFFAITELIINLKATNLNEITTFTPAVSTKRNEITKKLSRIHKRSGKIFSVDDLLYDNDIPLDKESIINKLIDLLTDRSENKITLGKFGAVWGLLIPEIKMRFIESRYQNNLKPHHDRIYFRPDFIENMNNDKTTQRTIINIVGLIASKKMNQVTSGLFKSMHLRQRFMLKHLQGALDTHRSHPNVFPNISDPSIVDHAALALEVLTIMTDPCSGFRDTIILPTAAEVAPFMPAFHATSPPAIINHCSGPVVTSTPWVAITPTDCYQPSAQQTIPDHTEAIPNTIGPLQQAQVPILNLFQTARGKLRQEPTLDYQYQPESLQYIL